MVTTSQIRKRISSLLRVLRGRWTRDCLVWFVFFALGGA